MPLNFEDGLGGAASGAALGSAVGPLGTVAGAAIGGLAGLFSNPRNPQNPRDPYAGMIQGRINSMLHSDTGAKAAAQIRARNSQNHQDTLRRLANNPGIGRNAAVMGAMSDDAERQREEGDTNAAIAGVQVDEAAKERGLSAAMGRSSEMYQRSDYEQNVIGGRRSPLQGLGMSVLGQVAGKIIGGDDDKKKTGLGTTGGTSSFWDNPPDLKMPWG